MVKAASAARWTLALAVLSSTAGAGEGYKGFPRGETLITAPELRQLQSTGDPRLVVLAIMEPLSYRGGHIPGSINVWRPDYEIPVGPQQPLDGMLLGRDAFEEFARGLGIDDDSRVVVYDEKYDATRLWWAFQLYGKTDVRVLDGGYPAWKTAGYETEASLGGGKSPRRGTFVARPSPRWMADMSDVWRARTSPHVRVWDAREPDEWSGTRRLGKARRAGRVPWARFQSWKEFRTEVEGRPTAFRTAPEIQRVIDAYGMSPHEEHIFYCQSGVRSTTAVFALYLMGWDPERLRNYDGSWLEWSFHEGNPIAAGQ